MLLLKKNDTLKDIIEKITLIPECKLMYFEVDQKCGHPKVRNMLSLSDLFGYIAATANSPIVLGADSDAIEKQE